MSRQMFSEDDKEVLGARLWPLVCLGPVSNTARMNGICNCRLGVQPRTEVRVRGWKGPAIEKVPDAKIATFGQLIKCWRTVEIPKRSHLQSQPENGEISICLWGSLTGMRNSSTGRESWMFDNQMLCSQYSQTRCREFFRW